MDVDKLKVRSMEDLFVLSIQSKRELYTRIKDAASIVSQMKKQYKSYFETVWVNNPLQIRIILNSLNVDQAKTFFSIFENLKNAEGSISTIDAGPGTGKTFLTACILMSYSKSSTYMVYTNRLSENMNALFFEGRSITCCKFLMTFLNMNYAKVKYMWYLKDKTFEEKCQEIEELSQTNKPFHPLYIIDENSVVSPFFIYFMACLRKHHKIHLIFIGDRYQQIPINATKYHMEPNYSLLNIMSDSVFNLSINVRQNQDTFFVGILKNFIAKFNDNNKNMNFAIKYFFYENLKSKFHTPEDFQATFFAQHHVVLKHRMDRYEQYLKKKKIPYTKSFLHVRVGKGRMKLEPMAEAEEITKFKPYITLVEGEEYTYAPNSTTCMTVVLKEIGKQYLKVYCDELKRYIMIRKIPLNIYFASEQLIAKIVELGYTCAYQFPLREKISTYHAAQGLTIASNKVELDMDCKSINSFYVGITRIKDLRQLTKIHTKELLSLAYSMYKKDDHFYKIVTYNDKHVDDASFSTCNNIRMFENAKINMKIPRSSYFPSKNANSNTELMQYIRNNFKNSSARTL